MSFKIFDGLILMILSVVSVIIFNYPVFAESSDKCNKIANFQKVSDGLWRGSQPSNNDLTMLSQSGIKTIIDLRSNGITVHKESKLVNSLGMNFFHIPLSYGTPSIEKVNQFLQIVTNKQYQPIYIHCRQGADRTGVLVGIYRMVVDGWPLDKAYLEMRDHHFKPWLWSLKHAIAAWEPVNQPVQATVAKHSEQSL